MPLRAAFTAFSPVKGRSRALSVRHAGRDITVVDDTYNANPDSMRAAIDVLAALPAPQLLVMGDMGEVGDQGPQFHAELAPMRARRALRTCMRWACSRPTPPRRSAAARHFDNMASLQAAVLEALPQVGGGSHHSVRAGTTRGSRPCCLAWPSGCRRFRPNSDSSGSSSI
jgi:UDP-N-acetylmuramoyl-tripeptide--D-alanyl-D-alanine ligase